MTFVELSLPVEGPLFCNNELAVDAQTWQQDIAQYRRKVQAMGLCHQSVLLFSENAYDFSVRLFALGMEGCNVILPPNNQPDTHHELAQLACAYCGDKVIDAQLPSVEDNTVTESKASKDTPLHWPHTGKLIFFTSGSTGAAKPIVKHWWQVNREVHNLIATFCCDSSPATTSVISTVSHQHVYGLLFKLLLPLATSMTIFPQYLYPEDMAKALGQIEKAIVVASPAFLTRLVQDNVLIPYKAKLQRIFSSGAPLPNEAAKLIYQQLSLPATQVYGSTETGGIAWRELTHSDTSWQPFRGIEISLAENSTLRIRSPYLVEEWTTLADRAAVTQTGTFTLLGRTDRIAKVEDKRLDLEDMEDYLRHHCAVENCRLLQLSGAKRTLVVVVAVQPGYLPQTPANKRQLVTQLKQYLANRFEPVCFPRKWRFVHALPYNTQGKLTHSSLEALFV